MGVDLVLSSGFLAFAEQAGFLAAVEQAGIEVDAVCGTSSGALAGVLWAAGLPAEAILDRLCAAAPLSQVAPHPRVWEGLFTLDPVRRVLAEHLPARLEELRVPVGVGTVAPGKVPRLVTRGPAVDAVLASCAVPWLFAPVPLDGVAHLDGGAVDRTFLGPWRDHRGDRPVVLHLVDRSAGAADTPIPPRTAVVRSPRSGARLWNLGDTRARFLRTRDAALRELRPLT